MSRPAVGVIAYGLGNLGSVLNMFRYLDVDAELVTTPEEIRAADRLLLPGVGAFDRGVVGLQEQGLGELVRERALAGTPLLGICLGMQLLCRTSEEGVLGGLGLIDANVTRLEPADRRLRVPHMGWNWVDAVREHELLESPEPRSKFYFAHSFKVVCSNDEDVVAVTDYGGTFTSIVAHGNVVGAQFHPEKSHRFGMHLLRNFAGWAP